MSSSDWPTTWSSATSGARSGGRSIRGADAVARPNPRHLRLRADDFRAARQVRQRRSTGLSDPSRTLDSPPAEESAMKHQLLLDYEFVTTQHGYVVRALIRLEGQAPPSTGARTPLNLSLVLDRSGSMHGEKLAAARDAAVFLVRRLAPEDVVTVIAYDGD